MHIGARASGEPFKKIGDQFRLQVTHEAGTHLGVDGERGASTEVYGGDGEGFVHGHEKVPGAQNAALVAKSTVESFTERDANVFDSVVLIDVEVTIALEFEIEGSVACKQFQHVIEKANAGRNFVLAFAFDG
jgi:hypothetical protein